jgi:hypothetical protein
VLNHNAPRCGLQVQKSNLKTYSKADDVQMRRKRVTPKMIQSGDPSASATDAAATATAAGAFSCTVCQKKVTPSTGGLHQTLGVLVCTECANRADDSPHGGCEWCGSTKDLAACGSDFQESAECEARFCRSCVESNNLSPTFEAIADMEEWQCFQCNSAPLRELKEAAALFDAAEGTATVGRAAGKRRRVDVSTVARRTGVTKPDFEEVDSDDGESDDERYTRMASEGIRLNTSAPAGEVGVYVHQTMSQMLKPHQIEGCRHLWDRVIRSIAHVEADPQGGDDPCGCVLAHCMGLGKTLQVIAFLHTVFTVVGKHIRTAMVVCPKNTIVNWHGEFDKWLSDSGIEHKWKVRKLDDNITETSARLSVLQKVSAKSIASSFFTFKSAVFSMHWSKSYCLVHCVWSVVDKERGGAPDHTRHVQATGGKECRVRIGTAGPRSRFADGR